MNVGHPRFSAVYCRMRFLCLGRSVGVKNKQKTKKKIRSIPLCGALEPDASIIDELRANYKVSSCVPGMCSCRQETTEFQAAKLNESSGRGQKRLES